MALLKKNITSLDSSIKSLLDIQKILQNDNTNYQHIYSKHKIKYEYNKGLYGLIFNYPSINKGIIIRKSLDYDRIFLSNTLLLKGIKYDRVLHYMSVISCNTECINPCIMLGYIIWLGLIPKFMLNIWSLKVTQLVNPIELDRILHKIDSETLYSFYHIYDKVYYRYCKMMGIECLQPFSTMVDLLNTDLEELKKRPIEQFDPLDISPKIEDCYKYNTKKILIVCLTLCLFSSTIYQSECINQLLS